MLLSYWTRLQPFELARWTGLLFFYRIFLVMNEPYMKCTWTVNEMYTLYFCYALELYMNCTWTVHELYMNCTIISKNIARAFKKILAHLPSCFDGIDTSWVLQLPRRYGPPPRLLVTVLFLVVSDRMPFRPWWSFRSFRILFYCQI